MNHLTKKQQRELFLAELLRSVRSAPPQMAKGHVGEKRKIEIRVRLETLSPLGWFYKHNEMHAGDIPIEYDQWGRCARCVALGYFRCGA
jgi:hypothetical protein